MRIISDFRDYYDVIQSMDQERTQIYLRKQKTITYERKNWLFPFIAGYDASFVGFCGKIYPVLTFNNYWDNMQHNGRMFYSFEQADAFELNEICKISSRKKEYLTKTKKAYDWHTKGYKVANYSSSTRQSLRMFFDALESLHSEHVKLFEMHHCPIFVAINGGTRPLYVEKRRSTAFVPPRLILNAQLKPLGFNQVLSPEISFGELLKYINNTAVPEKPMPKLDDVTMAESKGFNKWSFRKAPSK